jgi:uncharacterized protein (TIGR03503 family)
LKNLFIFLCVNLIVLVASLPVASSAIGQQAVNSAATQADNSPLVDLDSEYHNGITLLKNRFRIDYKVEEITMIFFREYGSAPIVLVRPDGSKIFQDQADGENVFWFDSSTYDMISIKKPMPGPWQAVGKILPQSRVMVISELQLHGEPLPKVMFSGEILKQTVYLTNGGKPIDYAAFRDVVSLNVDLRSTNNPDYNNFGAKAQTLATFEDNGKGMDETPLDGVFTGQFNLTIADGEWIPSFMVSTPMFTREQVGANIMLYPNPIKISVEMNVGGKGYHKLLVDASREHVDMATLLIDGKIRFPNGDLQNFSITDMSQDVREHLIVNNEYGVYRVKLTAFGNTVEGRDFILDVPEYSFLSEEPIVEVEATVDPGQNKTPSGLREPGIDDMPVQADEMSGRSLALIIIGTNGFLLIAGGALIWFVSRVKKIVPDNINQKKAGVDAKIPAKVSFFAALLARIPAKNKAPKEKKAKAKVVND